MTNQSPQDPQNPIPERRRRPAAGVTFDEMVAIFVAFASIGTILFFSLGGKRSQLASNLGLGGENSIFLADEDLVASLNDSEIAVESDDDLVIADASELESPLVLAPATRAFSSASVLEPSSYRFDSSRRLAPIAGVATLRGLNNEPDLDTVDEDTEIEVEVRTPDPENTEVEVEVGEATIPRLDGAGEDTEVELGEAATPELDGEDVEVEIEKIETPDPDAVGESTEMPEDVAPDYWAYPFVKQMREKALVPEIAKNQEFEPDTLITRASMATIISQAFDQRPANEKTKKFKDVTNQNALAKDIDRSVKLGFMQGYSDDEFRPLENIPRYQVLVSLATGLGLEPSQDAEQILQQFQDSADIPDWARQQVAAAAEAGLVVNPPGMISNALNPNEPATRGEVAAIVHQALVNSGRLQPIESEFIIQP